MTLPNCYRCGEQPCECKDGICLYHGDALDVLAALPEQSIQCCVCSPPYWGLRDYGTATWEGGDEECDHMPNVVPVSDDDPGIRKSTLGGGKKTTTAQAAVAYRDTCPKCGARRIDQQLGLEDTPDAYVAKMVEVFRGVWRVLRDDATCWINLGDSYASSGGTGHGGWDGNNKNPDGSARLNRQSGDVWSTTPTAVSGLKPKDLCGIPWRLAFALQADGWYLRSDIIWHKPNPMPESVTDRPTKAHEYVFLLSKKPRYFYDGEAIREEGVPSGWEAQRRRGRGAGTRIYGNSHDDNVTLRNDADRILEPTSGRNKRTVWTISTQSFPAAHFATFPTALVEPCIMAGTSKAGCCPECGTPWRRVVEKREYGSLGPERGKELITGMCRNQLGGQAKWNAYEGPTTVGWEPGCGCEPRPALGIGDAINCIISGEWDKTPIPCTVLDPFAGSGTTLQVARWLGRHAVGIELSAEYCELAVKRIQQPRERVPVVVPSKDQMVLF